MLENSESYCVDLIWSWNTNHHDPPTQYSCQDRSYPSKPFICFEPHMSCFAYSWPCASGNKIQWSGNFFLIQDCTRLRLHPHLCTAVTWPFVQPDYGFKPQEHDVRPLLPDFHGAWMFIPSNHKAQWSVYKIGYSFPPLSRWRWQMTIPFFGVIYTRRVCLW
jgi:hypothetical protein